MNAPAPSPRTLRVLADLADGERLKDIAKREGVTADALYRRLHRAGSDLGVRSTPALIATAIDRGWIVRTFEGWIVPDPGAPAAHAYLSTSCLHGDLVLPDGRTGHEYCRSETGHCGAKTPAKCKFCPAVCRCPCHRGGEAA